MRASRIRLTLIGILAIVLTVMPLTAIGETGGVDSVTVPEEALVFNGTTLVGISQSWATNNYPNGAKLSVTIPAQTTAIGPSAFDSNYVKYNNSYYLILRITGSYSVVAIDFSKATSLKTIGSQAFKDSAVQTVDLSNTRVETIDKLAFGGCKNLETVTLPQTLKYLGTSNGGSCFNGCSNLARVSVSGIESSEPISLPDGLEYIGTQVFRDAMTKISNSFAVTIPASVKTIGSSAFQSSKITQIVVDHHGDFSGYDVKAFYTSTKCLVVFDCAECKQAYTTKSGVQTSQMTYANPSTITFVGAGKDGSDLTQTKLAGASLAYELGDDGYWHQDSNYALPDTRSSNAAYTTRWICGGKEIAIDTGVWGEDEFTFTLEKVFNTDVDVRMTTDGVASDTVMTIQGNTSVSSNWNVCKTDVLLDGKSHTIGVQATHPLTLDAGGTKDDYVYFKYCWYDEVSTYTNVVIDSTPYGPRSASEPELFSSADTEVWTDAATIPVASVSDARTSHDGLADYYLVKIRAYHVVNGVETLFLETSHNFIGVGSSVNPASLLMQVTTKVALTYDLNDGSDAAAEVEASDAGATETVKNVDVPTGMKFLGWVDGDGKLWQPGDEITLDGPVTLTAQWQELGRGTIEPVSMTAYVGGISASGGTMPTVRYRVTAPSGANLNALTFTLHTVTDGVESAESLAYSRIDSCEDSLFLFPALDDAWNQNADSYAEADTLIQRGSYLKAVTEDGSGASYAGLYALLARTGDHADWDAWYVTATDADGNEYYMDLYDDDADETTAEYTILSVSAETTMNAKPSTYLTRLLDGLDSVTSENLSGVRKAAALSDESLTFVTNGDEHLGLIGCESSQTTAGYADGKALVALLFDDAMNLGAADENDLAGRVVEAASAGGEDFSTWGREFKYLDLVNVNDGNARVEIAGGGKITVVWPYPEGLSYEDAAGYTFAMLHCPGIDRADASSYEFADGELPEVETLALTATEHGLVFQTSSFSPFMLVWKKNETPAQPEVVDPSDLLGDETTGDGAGEDGTQIADERGATDESQNKTDDAIDTTGTSGATSVADNTMHQTASEAAAIVDATDAQKAAAASDAQKAVAASDTQTPDKDSDASAVGGTLLQASDSGKLSVKPTTNTAAAATPGTGDSTMTGILAALAAVGSILGAMSLWVRRQDQ